MALTPVDEWSDQEVPTDDEIIEGATWQPYYQQCLNRDEYLRKRIAGLADSMLIEVPLEPIWTPTKWERVAAELGWRHTDSTGVQTNELHFIVPAPAVGKITALKALVRFDGTPTWPLTTKPSLGIIAKEYVIDSTTVNTVGSGSVYDPSSSAAEYQNHHWIELTGLDIAPADNRVVMAHLDGQSVDPNNPGFELYRMLATIAKP